MTTAGSLTITKVKVADGGSGSGVKAGDDNMPIDGDGNPTTDPSKYVKVVDVRGAAGADAPIYDGTPKVPEVYDVQCKDGEGNPKKLVESTDYEVAYYEANPDGTPNMGQQCNAIDAGKKVAVVTLKGNYDGTVSVPMGVQQRPITFKGDSNSLSYDGKEHVVDTLTLGGEGLAEGHTHGIGYLAEGTAIDEYEGAFVRTNDASGSVVYDETHQNPDTSTGFVFDDQGTDVSRNYAISFELGKLTIGAAKVEDGGNGQAMLVDNDGNPVTSLDGKQVVCVDVTPDYGTGKAPVYDGKDHAPVAHDVRNGKDLVEGTDYTVSYYEPQLNGDGTAKTDGKGKLVPDTAKPLTAADAGTTSAGDKVAVVEFKGEYTGTVTIGVNVLRRPVAFTGKSAKKTCNAQKQTITGYDASTGANEGLLTGKAFGHTTVVAGADTVAASASGTKAGTYRGTITKAADVRVVDRNGGDVTKNYRITTTAGTLTIGLGTSKLSTVAHTSKGAIDVSWKAIKGAQAYKLQWRAAGGKWHTVTTKGTTTTVKGLKQGKAYELRVRAESGKVSSTWSKSACRWLKSVSSIKVKSTKTGTIKVSWKADKQATAGYQVFVRYKSGGEIVARAKAKAGPPPSPSRA